MSLKYMSYEDMSWRNIMIEPIFLLKDIKYSIKNMGRPVDTKIYHKPEFQRTYHHYYLFCEMAPFL